MKAKFDDIRSRIAEEPSWFDGNGTPRYGKFLPDESPDIYADEVVLLDIGCQMCGKRFMVGMHWSVMDSIEAGEEMRPSRMGVHLHYGDPPAHGCTGDTMNCMDYRIVEFWRQTPLEKMVAMSQPYRFERVPELEIALIDSPDAPTGVTEL